MNPIKLISRRVWIRTAAGIFLFAVAFWISGPSAVLSHGQKGMAAFGTLLGLSAAALALRAAAWKISLAQQGRKNVPFIVVLRAAAALGGTPVRLGILRKKAGIADAAGAWVADAAVRSFAALVFCAIALFLGFLLCPGNIWMRGLMLIMAVGGFGGAVIVTRGRRQFFTSLLGVLPRRLVSPAVRGRMEERDRYFQRYRKEGRTAFTAAFFIHVAVFLILSLEILAVGNAIDAYFPDALSLSLASLVLVLRFAFSVFPASIGGLECGIALVLALTFGAPFAAVGVAIVVVLRLLTLCWWAIGLASAGNPAKILFGKL